MFVVSLWYNKSKKSNIMKNINTINEMKATITRCNEMLTKLIDTRNRINDVNDSPSQEQLDYALENIRFYTSCTLKDMEAVREQNIKHLAGETSLFA